MKRRRRLEYDYGDVMDFSVGTASADLAGLGLDPAEQIALAEELSEAESKRIRPGFYVGLDYKVSRDDDEDEEDVEEAQTDHYVLVDAKLAESA